MKKTVKKLIAAVTSVCMVCAGLALPSGISGNSHVSVAYGETIGAYSCDFNQLVKSATENTVYGTAANVISLDDYTTAVLTYEGTYAAPDGKIYLTGSGSNKGNGEYKKGSYIQFVAPADGKLEIKGSSLNYFDGETYKTYGGSWSYDVKEGGTYNISSRTSSTYISSLTFTPPVEPTPVVTKNPADMIPAYTSPSTAWDFNEHTPENEGYNRPVISGTASYDETNHNIKFDAATTGAGSLSLNLKPAVKSSVMIDFDAYMGKLGGQMVTYTVTDSEGNELIYCQLHPYGGAEYMANGLRIGGVSVADGNTVTKAITGLANDGMSAAPTHYKTKIDFHAKTAKVTIGTTEFTGDIQDYATGDIAAVDFTVSRAKSASGRNCYFDNLSVSEFISTEPVKPSTITEGYLEGSYSGAEGTMPYRYYLPSGYDSSKKYPVLVYLHGESRTGHDNVNQLYNARYMFDRMKEDSSHPCILIAPQCPSGDAWVNTDAQKGTYDIGVAEQTSASKLVTGVLEDMAAKYSIDTDKIYLAGQSMGAYGCWDLALRNPDKFAALVPIAGAGSVNPTYVQALAAANIGVWAFHGYNDTVVPVSGARDIISALQKAAATDVRYTELTFGTHAIGEEAANTEELYSWLSGKSLTANASAKEEERVVDLATFMGQSNMAGRGDYKDAVPCPPGHGYEFHAVTTPNVLTSVAEPFGKYENNSAINDNGSNGVDRRGGDLVSSFMESYYQASGVPIVGVQCSRGGTASSWWNGSSVLSEAVIRFKAAKDYLEASGYTVRRQFMVWCQGESDADSNVSTETYKTRTKNVFNHMKANTGLDHLFIIKTGHTNIYYRVPEGEEPTADSLALDAKYQRINAAQKALADENADITEVSSFFTDEYLAQMRDPSHYYQPVYNAVGEMAGYNTAVKYDPLIGTPIPVPDSSVTPPPTVSPSAPPVVSPSPTPIVQNMVVVKNTENEVVEQGKALEKDMTIQSVQLSGDLEQEGNVVYVAVYSADGTLLRVAVGKEVNLAAARSEQVKAFVWNQQSMEPQYIPQQ